MAGSFLEDDLDAILNADDFAVVGVHFPNHLPSFKIKGIFDDEDLEIEDERGNMMVRSVRFQTKTSHDVRYGERIMIKAVWYRVGVVQDDGTGMTTLHLEKIDDA